MPKLPPQFIEQLKTFVPPERFNSIINSFSQKKPITFRVNTLKASIKEITNEINTTAVPNFDNAFQVPAEQREILTYSKAFLDGHIYIQNLSSMLAPLVLDPQPGEEVLDLTAAPGSKTTQMATLMNNIGRIAAIEKIKGRYYKLKDNCKKQGATCVDFYCKDGAIVWRSCENRFDRVLLDAPCSSEGRFNINDPKTFQYWSEKKIKDMARKQWKLLYSAFRSLKPGGILVYSTCTFAPEENEQQISKLIKKFGDTILIEKINLPIKNIQPGKTPITNAIRILPNDLMDAFFLCRIKKLSNYSLIE